MSIQNIEKTIRAYVVAGTDLSAQNVIPGNDNAPRPTGTYATLLTVSPTPRSFAIPIDYGGGQVQMLRERQVLMFLQFFRKGAVDLALDFTYYAESETGLAKQQTDEFRIVNVPLDIRRLDGLVAEDFEERAQIDLRVDYVDVIDQNLDYVETVEGTMTVNTAGTTQTVETDHELLN